MKSKKILSLLLTGAILAGMVPAALAEGAPVAQIGEQTYTDFAEALAAARGGATLQLLDDVTLSSEVTIGKAASDEDAAVPQIFTLDLNGKTATVTGQISIRYGSGVTIQDSADNGKIALNDKGRFAVYGDMTYRDGAKPTQENAVVSALELESGTIASSNQANIGLFGNGATFHMTGGTVVNSYKNGSTDGNFAIAGNGTRKAAANDKSAEDDGGIRLIIEGGTVKSEQDCAIYLPGYNDTTISGGTIEGWSGIEIDSGNLTISGDAVIRSTYSGDGTRKYKTSGDGNYNFGAALAIVSKGAGNSSKTGYYGNMNIKIEGGTFESQSYYAIDEYNLAYVQSQKDTAQTKATENAGYFVENGLSITDGVFTGASGKGGILSDTQKGFIIGGTFSGDPSDYAGTGYLALKNKDNSYTVRTWDEFSSATLDVSKSGGLTADGMGLSGTVDMRTYTISDATLKEDFEDLLAETRSETAALSNETISLLYVKHGLDLAFASIKFTENGQDLASDQNYYIQQVNPGLNYAYGADTFADNTKGKVYTGAQLKDGLNFIVSSAVGDITFKIARCAAGANALPEGAKTFTVTNGVTFTNSEAPKEDAPVVEVKPSVSTDGGVTTAAGSVEADVAGKVTAAAGTADKTLTIDAGNVGTAEVDKTELTLDSAVVKALAEATTVTTEIVTPVGTVTLPAKAAAQIKAGATSDGTTSDVVLTVEAVTSKPDGTDAAYKVEIKKSGETDALSITGLTEAIKLSFDVGAGRDDNPTLVYVDTKSGNALKPIANSHYDANTGILTGSTLHLSTFAVRKAVYGTTADATAGIGKKVTLTAAKGNYLTVQVTNNGANAIYTVQVPDGGAVEIYVPTGSVLSVWETTGVPTFANGVMAPNGYIGSWVNQTIN